MFDHPRYRHGPHHRHEAHPHTHDEPRKRARRLFQHGDLRFVILHLLGERPRHGYEIIKAIEDKVGGAYSPSPGIVYPTLTLLEELGYASVETDASARKLYSLTDAGRSHLAENRTGADAVLARIDEAAGPGAREHMKPVRRAMENLRTALRLKLEGAGEFPAERIDAITRAIDDAARAVDRA